MWPACTRRFQFKRIQLVTVGEGLVSELRIGLKGTMNALFIKDLAAKTHRGMQGKSRPAGRQAVSPLATACAASSTPWANPSAAGARSFRRSRPGRQDLRNVCRRPFAPAISPAPSTAIMWPAHVDMNGVIRQSGGRRSWHRHPAQ